MYTEDIVCLFMPPLGPNDIELHNGNILKTNREHYDHHNIENKWKSYDRDNQDKTWCVLQACTLCPGHHNIHTIDSVQSRPQAMHKMYTLDTGFYKNNTP